MEGAPMNPIIKAEWLTALRSGRYPKGKGRLVTDNGGKKTYCCLGVLCELAVEAGIIDGVPRTRVNDGSITPVGVYLPDNVAEWAGIERISVSVGTIQSKLGATNDETEDFEAVIKMIEEKL